MRFSSVYGVMYGYKYVFNNSLHPKQNHEIVQPVSQIKLTITNKIAQSNAQIV